MFRVVSRFEAFPMKRIHPRRFVFQFVLSAVLAVLPSWVPVSRAVAQDLSGFSVMLQRGDAYYPEAIEISPDGRWFLTASWGSIYLSDVESGAVLRAIVPPVTIGRVAISRDGRDIFTESAPYKQPEVFGWKAETGAPISNAQAEAPATDDPAWSWIDKWWPSKDGPPVDMRQPKKYVVDLNIAQLVDANRVERVEPTNRENIVQVTVAAEPQDGEDDFAAYHYYFIDIVRKKVVADVVGKTLAGKTLNTFCGEPHGAFAFKGRYLIVAPIELADVRSSLINSLVVDTEAKPPVLKWRRSCQNYRVSGMEMQNGMIVVTRDPSRVRVWDPATARLLAVLDDIYDSDVLSWSRDLTTFATGFHEALANFEGDKFGVSVLRSGKKLFIPTRERVNAIRFNSDGSAVFALTQAGWAAWDTSSGANLPLNTPLPDEGFGAKYVWDWSELKPFTIVVSDAASGKQLWTATANDGEGDDFLLMEFPDGRVRLSKGAEPLVRLVRGFEVRPFDDAAKKAFVRP
jgi:hypothetical protein